MFLRLFHLLLIIVSGNSVSITFRHLFHVSFLYITSTFTNSTVSIKTDTVFPVILNKTLEVSPSPIQISYVNGIYHTVDDWTRISRKLSVTFNQEIKPFYNPSSGWWVNDITSAGYELLIRKTNDFIVAQQLASHLRNLLVLVGPNGRVLHIAHSGGAILTYLAAKYHLTISECNRIDIITFGAGRSLTHKYFHGRVRNYYARNDPVMLVDRRAAELFKKYCRPNRAKSTIQSYRPYLGLSVGNVSETETEINQSIFEVRDSRHNTSFIFLTGMNGNPILDHSMEYPTYTTVLEYEAKEFHKRLALLKAFNLQRVKEINSGMLLIRRIRKGTARMTGMHHFWRRFSTPSAESIQSVTPTAFSSSSISNANTSSQTSAVVLSNTSTNATTSIITTIANTVIHDIHNRKANKSIWKLYNTTEIVTYVKSHLPNMTLPNSSVRTDVIRNSSVISTLYAKFRRSKVNTSSSTNQLAILNTNGSIVQLISNEPDNSTSIPIVNSGPISLLPIVSIGKTIVSSGITSTITDRFVSTTTTITS